MPDDHPPFGHHPGPLAPPRGRTRRVEFVFVLLGGLLLTACAGFTNTIVLTESALPATHVSGSVSRLSSDLGRGDTDDAVRVTALLAAFASGAVVSGVLIAGAELRLGRRYGIVTMLEALLLAAAAAAFPRSPLAGATLAAAAAGMQNAMASSYGGQIVRTTHVTGILTDLGFLLGQVLRGHPPRAWRMLLLTGLLGSFFAGGVLGARCDAAFGTAALLVPSVVLLLAGATYTTWRVLHADRHA